MFVGPFRPRRVGVVLVTSVGYKRDMINTRAVNGTDLFLCMELKYTAVA